MKLLHTVGEAAQFIQDCHAARVSEKELKIIVDTIAANPLQGDEIKGSGGVRKVRFAGKGKGKSGGYRVVSVWLGIDAPVFLIALLSKGDRGNFSAAEIAGMKFFVESIKKKLRREK